MDDKFKRTEEITIKAAPSNKFRPIYDPHDGTKIIEYRKISHVFVTEASACVLFYEQYPHDLGVMVIDKYLELPESIPAQEPIDG